MAVSKTVAVGKWHIILKDCKLSDKQLSGSQSPCPVCGGKDRFRFDNKGGRGTWYCNSCGAGDGYRLYMLINKIESFDAAVKVVAEKYKDVVGETQKAKPPMKGMLNRLWSMSKPGAKEIVAYLASRGIKNVPEHILLNLRFHPECPWKDGPVSGKAPAMLTKVWSKDKPVTLHRTFLTTDVPNRKMVMPHDGETLSGATIRLDKIKGVAMGVAEGIETALSAAQMSGWSLPVWACYAADQLERFKPPEVITTVDIYGDNDASFTGQKAAYVLANRLFKNSINANVRIPSVPGMDWNDALREIQSAEAQSGAVRSRDG